MKNQLIWWFARNCVLLQCLLEVVRQQINKFYLKVEQFNYDDIPYPKLGARPRRRIGFLLSLSQSFKQRHTRFNPCSPLRSYRPIYKTALSDKLHYGCVNPATCHLTTGAHIRNEKADHNEQSSVGIRRLMLALQGVRTTMVYYIYCS